MSDNMILNKRYQLEERLGSGGMAVVYRAQDLMLERYVAVKILRESYSADSEFKQRFHQEAKAAANLSHPNIITIHDFGFDVGRLFIIMEYVPGTDLKSLLQQRGKFPVDETIELMIQACAGIGYAHRAGLIHCDIKPHNMIITPDKRLKVTDFGIARALASIQPEEKTDIVWGSPQYFSPEQAAGNAPSPASDVYSLGIVMYEMLAGQLPFNAASATELAKLHRQALPPSIHRYNPAVPRSLEQIIIKVLSKEPSARYRTADQLGRVLVHFTPHSKNTAAETNATVTKASKRPVDQFTVLNKNDRTAQPAPHPKPVDPQFTPDQAAPRISFYDKNPLSIDWITTLLALLALTFVGGLIPFFLWIYFLLQNS
ncbi:MAG: serine/threonine protein kinase [Anaerolineales bacterium]|nr:serine/threonine protein kinase [Anaerolineales bacterium]